MSRSWRCAASNSSAPPIPPVWIRTRVSTSGISCVLRKTRTIGRRGQGRADLCDDNVWQTMDVRGGETQEAKAGIDDQVLPAVVLNEALAGIAPLIFDNEARRVIERCPTHQLLAPLPQVPLHLPAVQPLLDPHPPNPPPH